MTKKKHEYTMKNNTLCVDCELCNKKNKINNSRRYDLTLSLYYYKLL